MSEERDRKLEEAILEIAARFIERESNKTSLITVNRVELHDRGRTAIIAVSVLPEDGESSALNFLKRKRAELRDAIKSGLNIRTIPFIDVEIDRGAKALHTIEALLKE